MMRATKSAQAGGCADFIFSRLEKPQAPRLFDGNTGCLTDSSRRPSHSNAGDFQ
ncbi:hypothetical protein BSIN_4157 [Burkholderia singularis]|uniref:Uncharacterized protein n=1 Tax=Burkholderia singularis TaxID=1503053 RepID=A0A238H7R2_9BURK|nr:hypothetical protein BSIN_4157 [Burkholderia singularis]